MVVETPGDGQDLTTADVIHRPHLEIAEDPQAEAATTEATLKEAIEALQLTTKDSRELTIGNHRLMISSLGVD